MTDTTQPREQAVRSYEYQPRHENGQLLDWSPLTHAETDQEAREYCEPRGFAWRRTTPVAAPEAVKLMEGVEQYNRAFDKACGKFYCEHGRLPAPIEIFAIASPVAAPEAPTSEQQANPDDICQVCGVKRYEPCGKVVCTAFYPAATTASASGLDEAAAYRLWRDCEIAEDAWFIEHLSGCLPRDCSSRAPTAAEWDAAMLRVMQDRKDVAATEKKEQK